MLVQGEPARRSYRLGFHANDGVAKLGAALLVGVRVADCYRTTDYTERKRSPKPCSSHAPIPNEAGKRSHDDNLASTKVNFTQAANRLSTGAKHWAEQAYFNP
jgi:hypothetical protein